MTSSTTLSLSILSTTASPAVLLASMLKRRVNCSPPEACKKLESAFQSIPEQSPPHFPQNFVGLANKALQSSPLLFLFGQYLRVRLISSWWRSPSLPGLKIQLALMPVICSSWIAIEAALAGSDCKALRVKVCRIDSKALIASSLSSWHESEARVPTQRCMKSSKLFSFSVSTQNSNRRLASGRPGMGIWRTWLK